MADLKTSRLNSAARTPMRAMLASSALLVLATAQQAQAQAQGRVVSACSGVSLPPSAVTGIISPVLTGITGPTERIVNGILDLPLLGWLLGPLELNVTGLLEQAAAGQPVTLQALATDGTVLGPADQCRVTSDSLTLNTPAGVAIGGNQITGLGADGQAAFASDINAIAFGNNARAEAGATASMALGQNSSVTAANSVALGAGAVAGRGALTGYTATGLAGPQTSVGEVSIGAPGALRQLTNVAAGTAPNDAATVGQVDGVLAQVTALGDASVQYDGATRDRVTLAGATGTVIGNVAPGALTADSTEAVNGAQLFATNQAVGANTTAITNNTNAITDLDARVTTNTNLLGTLDATSVRYDAADRATVTFGGTDGTVLANVAPGALAADSTQAVNGAQLFATNQVVGANTTAITNLDARVTTNTNLLGTLDATSVRYDGADRATVTFGGTDGTVLANVAPGALAADSTQAVNGAQLFATNQAVGANTTAITNNTNAITNLDARLTTNTNLLGTLDATSVRYDGADRATVTFGGSGGTVLANVAPGALAADSTQAVNGAQLFATNAQVAANTAAIAGIASATGAGPVRYSNADAPTVPNGGTVTNNATLVGAAAGAVALHNVGEGALAAGSTDAVNGGQLFTTNQAVATNTGAITNLDARVTNNTTAISDLDTRVINNTTAITDIDARVTNNTTAITDLQNNVTNTGTAVTNLTTQVDANTTAITNINTTLANQPLRYADAATPTVPNGGAVSDDVTLVGASGGPVGLHNVRAGTLAAGSTDAVNGDQLAATNAQVAANTTAITNFNNLVVGSAVSPVQYSNAGTPTVPNGGTLTNHVTLVGADAAAPVALHNIAGGAVSATSTDAVNGQQLHAVSTTASNSIQYDRDATGTRTNTVTLAGGDPAAAVTLANVAAGTVAAGSTQAVNGGQLHATNQVAQQAAALGANSVQYDASATSVTFRNTGGSAVTLRNVAAGVAATDAVNVGQLQSGMQSAVAQANSYTDQRLASTMEALNFDLRRVRRDIGAGTSAALAAAALPQANEPGRTMVAIGGGTYRGQSAVAFGASTFLDDGHSILRLGASIDSRGFGGANAGYGYQF